MSAHEQDRVQAIYDDFSATYDEHYTSAQFQEEDAALFKIVGPWIRGTVLDLGCGTGMTLAYNQIAKEDYLGVDPSAGMLSKLTLKFPGYKTLQSTFESFIEEGNSSKYDTVLGLFGGPSYFDKESYARVLETLTPKGHYFLMFYKPGYFPAHIYTEEDKAATLARIDYDLINTTFETTFIFTQYLVATNIPKEFLPIR
jgi:SAM-dependent methyltransferase